MYGRQEPFPFGDAVVVGFESYIVQPIITFKGFAELLKELVDKIYPVVEKMVLFTDNLNIHHLACLYERYLPEEVRRTATKIEWHYTPIHTSWLNIAKCELSVLKRQCLSTRITTIEQVTMNSTHWASQRNTAQVGVN